jgi:hypothetical protein
MSAVTGFGVDRAVIACGCCGCVVGAVVAAGEALGAIASPALDGTAAVALGSTAVGVAVLGVGVASVGAPMLTSAGVVVKAGAGVTVPLPTVVGTGVPVSIATAAGAGVAVSAIVRTAMLRGVALGTAVGVAVAVLVAVAVAVAVCVASLVLFAQISSSVRTGMVVVAFALSLCALQRQPSTVPFDTTERLAPSDEYLQTPPLSCQ